MTTTKSEEDVIMRMNDASVTFDLNRGTSRVLDQVDLDVYRDEVLGIVGESGSGKSMLASTMLDAVVEPGNTSGNITYRKQTGEQIDILNLPDNKLRRLRWEEIAMVFQGAMSSFNPTINIRSHFKETLEAHAYDLSSGMERAQRLLQDLYLEPERVLNSYPHELSGGMKQRTLIALSLLLDPDILIMDEPTAALDLLMQRSIISLLRRLKNEYDITLVFITHDLPLVARLADRLCVLYAFQIAEIGPTEEIIRESTHPYTRMLLKSVPNLDAPVENMQAIEGSPPDPVDVPSGCSFHPRCPMAQENCRSEDPDLLTVDNNHASACFYWEDTADAIPYDIEEALMTGPNPLETRESPQRLTENGVSENNRDVGAGEREPLIELDNVTIEFEINQDLLSIFSEPETISAVDNVSLEIGENDVIALVGESGCGKTTLGKALIGIHRPKNGSVKYNGANVWDVRDGNTNKDVEFSQIRQALQIIHQDPGSSLNPNQRVITSLLKPIKKKQPGLSRAQSKEKVHAMVERVGMTPPKDYAKRYPHQLSGGEKQRVALIRALLMNPDLILADEAISALDVSLRVETMNLLLDLQNLFDTSFVFISHDLSNARYLTEKANGRIAVMYMGEIVEIGSVNQIINNSLHPYTQVLRWATPDLNIQSDETEDPPVREIDIPDPANPPTGCRFHTRCPHAREVCTKEHPSLISTEDEQAAACFRADPNHHYWNSDPITDESANSDSLIESDETR